MLCEKVCLQRLFECAFSTALISEIVWKQIPDGRTGDREWPTATYECGCPWIWLYVMTPYKCRYKKAFLYEIVCDLVFCSFCFTVLCWSWWWAYISLNVFGTNIYKVDHVSTRIESELLDISFWSSMPLSASCDVVIQRAEWKISDSMI